jgi:hypothetical protein
MDKYLLGLAGETRVCAELLKKGFHANIVIGNAKATDIVITNDKNKFLRIEVKTTQKGRKFVTGFYPKYTDSSKLCPNLWVFYLPDKTMSTGGDRFFIARHEKVGEIQLQVNKGNKTARGEGVDNIPLKFLEDHQCEDDWAAIATALADI